jgi:hypothetical protein
MRPIEGTLLWSPLPADTRLMEDEARRIDGAW